MSQINEYLIDIGQGWRLAAACHDHPADMFFPDRGESALPAKRVCAGCPVKVPCLQFALDNRERYGVYGNTSEKERRDLLRSIEAGEAILLRPPVREERIRFLTAVGFRVMSGPGMVRWLVPREVAAV